MKYFLDNQSAMPPSIVFQKRMYGEGTIYIQSCGNFFMVDGPEHLYLNLCTPNNFHFKREKVIQDSGLRTFNMPTMHGFSLLMFSLKH